LQELTIPFFPAKAGIQIEPRALMEKLGAWRVIPNRSG
jgi:hypothetical protein